LINQLDSIYNWKDLKYFKFSDQGHFMAIRRKISITGALRVEKPLARVPE
jgi:hypothetical protein